MSSSYALLLGLVIFLILFIYFVFLSVSLRLEKNESEAEIAIKRKSVPFRWKDLVDSKNKKLGWIDLYKIKKKRNIFITKSLLECGSFILLVVLRDLNLGIWLYINYNL